MADGGGGKVSRMVWDKTRTSEVVMSGESSYRGGQSSELFWNRYALTQKIFRISQKETMSLTHQSSPIDRFPPLLGSLRMFNYKLRVM